MNENPVVQLLKSSLAFRGLEPADLELLASHCQIRETLAGESIVQQGDPGDEMFVVEAGQFQVFVRQEGLGLERTLHVMEAGEIFGEIALLTGGQRTASVRAVGDGRLLVLARTHFIAALEKSPTLALALCAALGQHIAAVNRKESYMPFRRISDYRDAAAHRSLLPQKVAMHCRAVPVARTEQQVTIAIVDPYDLDARNFVAQILHPLIPEFVVVSEEEFVGFLHGTESPDDMQTLISEGQPLKLHMPGTGLADFEATETDIYLRIVLTKAINNGASDIHLETKSDVMQTRLRIEGNLVKIEETISAGQSQRVVSRIKILANLDPTEHRQPQDGVFAIQIGAESLSLRVSIVPGVYGETAVLRILWNERASSDSLESIAVSRAVSQWMRDLFLQPGGLLLVTGSAGAGKTTSLYAGLATTWLNKPLINIITIEDPVDRRLQFATQLQVDVELGRTFPLLLRAVLRQDPDVLLVGEIRDHESATIATEAATSGHLVLASLHSRRALSAVTRLRSLGVESYVLATALTGIISQCLLRRNCAACAVEIPHPAADDSIKELVRLGVLGRDDGGYKRGKGCDICSQSGLKGRIACFEIFEPARETRERLALGMPVEEVGAQLVENEYLPMEAYARHLLMHGIVAPEQVLAMLPRQGGLQWREDMKRD